MVQLNMRGTNAKHKNNVSLYLFVILYWYIYNAYVVSGNIYL